MSEALKKYLDHAQKSYVEGQRLPYATGIGSKSVGEHFTTSNEYKSFLTSGAKSTNNVAIDRKALVTSVGGAGALLGATKYLNDVYGPSTFPMTIRALLRAESTSQNMIEYMQRTAYTNSAAPQVEGEVKGESAFTFVEKSAKVQTLAHWIPATRQAIADVSGLRNYIDTQLVLGIQSLEEKQILYGAGTGVNLEGLMVTAGTQDMGVMPGTGVTKIDFLRKALTKVFLSGNVPSGIVLHPNDWEDIQLLKGTDGHYLFINVGDGSDMKMFKVPVVQSINMVQGDFLTGAFGVGAQIFDRETVNVRISESNADDFVRNKLTILCEERLAFPIFVPSAFVKGKFA